MDNVFYRNLKTEFLEVERGEGIYLFDVNGKKYIDACAGAAVSNLGHGHPRIVKALSEQAGKIAFSHLSRWTSAPVKKMADLIASVSPGSLNKTYPVSGGSEATESALKMARQYYLERDGKSGKFKIISRWNTFHGNTIGALSMTGDKRRKKYDPLLLDFPKITAPYCYRCPLNLKKETCQAACAWELEKLLKQMGADTVAAFIAEPIIGAAAGALVPHDDYFKIIRDTCDKYDILFIADEVMVGFGRAGSMFAMEAFGVVPDMICAAKGMSAGYIPLGAVIAKDEIYETFKKGSGAFVHGHTYGGNPLAGAVATEVIQTLLDEKLVENSRIVGEYLLSRLREKLDKFWFVGDVRGRGLMQGVELVQNKETKEPFPASFGLAEKITVTLSKHGVIVYPGSGQADGENGDQFLVAPPLILTRPQADELADLMAAGFEDFAQTTLKNEGK